MMKKRGQRLTVVIGIAVLNAVAAGALGLSQRGAFQLSRSLTFLAVCVVAITAVLGSILAAIREVRGASVDQLRRKFEATLRVTLCTVAVHTGLGTCDMGIAVWRVRRKPPFVGRKVLRPIFRQRGAYSPGPSGVDWQLGKGTHGLCVRDGTYQWRNLGVDYERYGQVSNEDWNTVPDDVRQDMKLGDFRKAVGRYRFAAAAPMLQQVEGEDEVVGCLMLDVPSTGTGACLTQREMERLTSEDVEQVLKGAAGVVANYLP